MRAITLRSFGSPDGLELTELPLPTPDAGHVRIRVEAIGVGGVDALIRRGMRGTDAFPAGWVPGNEVAGLVDAVGPGVDAAWEGRRVWAFTGEGGAYVESAVVSLSDVVELPAELSFVDAAALGSSATVAHYALERARLAAGDRVLIRGAAGSIGIAAIELARRAGAAVVAVTTSSPERGRRLTALGATHVLTRAGTAMTDGEQAPDGYDVVVDIVGGEGVADAIASVAPNGRMVTVGIVAGFPPPDFGSALIAHFRRSITFGILSLDSIEPSDLQRTRARLFDDAARGDLHAVVEDVLLLEDAVVAHRRMDEGDVFGRFVLVPGGAHE